MQFGAGFRAFSISAKTDHLDTAPRVRRELCEEPVRILRHFPTRPPPLEPTSSLTGLRPMAAKAAAAAGARAAQLKAVANVRLARRQLTAKVL